MEMNENLITTEEVNVPPKKYGIIDALAAVLVFIFGYAFIDIVFSRLGIGMTIFCVLFAAGTVLYSVLKKGNIKVSVIGGAVLSLFSTSYFLFDNDYLKGWSAFFTVVLVPVWYLMIFSPNVPKDGDLFLKSVKSWIIVPFGNFPSIFPALGGFSNGKGDKKFGKALLGIAIAFIPTLIIGSWLLTAGAEFSNVFNSVFEKIFDNFGEFILKMIFAVPVAMYIFGTVFGNSNNSFPNIISDEQCEKCHKAVKKLNGITVFFATLPIIILFAAYIITENIGMISNLQSELKAVPKNAVDGFFELCKSSALSLVFIVLISVFGKTKEKITVGKICITVISALNLGIVLMAYYKLFLYIDGYGLTEKRVYAAWMITLIALMFIFMIIKQFIGGFPIVKTAAVTAAVLFVILCFSNVNRIIASYNIRRYINSGYTTEFTAWDVRTLSENSGGVIELEKHYDELDTKTKTQVRSTIRESEFIKRDLPYEYEEDDGFKSFNIERNSAEKAAENIASKKK